MSIPWHGRVTQKHRDAVKGARLPFRVGESGSGWHVFDADGRCLTGISRSAAHAETVCMNLERAARMKWRKCLRCPTMFWSEGPHHRNCGCRQHVDDHYDPHALGVA